MLQLLRVFALLPPSFSYHLTGFRDAVQVPSISVERTWLNFLSHVLDFLMAVGRIWASARGTRWGRRCSIMLTVDEVVKHSPVLYDPSLDM